MLLKTCLYIFGYSGGIYQEPQIEANENQGNLACPFRPTSSSALFKMVPGRSGRAIRCNSSVCSVPPHPCGISAAIPARNPPFPAFVGKQVYSFHSTFRLI
jgi:hypothetical protein